MARKGLTFKVFTLTGQDIRQQGLTDGQVTAIINELESIGKAVVGGQEIINNRFGKLTKADYDSIYNEAMTAGLKAGQEHTPTPMVVTQRENVLNDNSPITKAWHVSEGICGFAWVNVDANTGFGKYLRDVHKHTRSYRGGYDLWCHEFGQSYERKCAWAGAVADVLKAHGIKAYVGSRLD